jgi:hypothetical protein
MQGWTPAHKLVLVFMQVVDIANTYNDNFAKLIRRDLRRCGIHKGATVVFSPEPMAADSMREVERRTKFKRSYYGTMPYMPAIFGMHAAAHVTAEISGVGRRCIGRKRIRAAGARPQAKGCAFRHDQWHSYQRVTAVSGRMLGRNVFMPGEVDPQMPRACHLVTGLRAADLSGSVRSNRGGGETLGAVEMAIPKTKRGVCHQLSCGLPCTHTPTRQCTKHSMLIQVSM